MQRITTREPDDTQLEIALAALKNAIPEEFGGIVQDCGKIEDGTIRPTIFKVFPIEEAEAAQQLMYSGKSAGKIVLAVGQQES